MDTEDLLAMMADMRRQNRRQALYLMQLLGAYAEMLELDPANATRVAASLKIVATELRKQVEDD